MAPSRTSAGDTAPDHPARAHAGTTSRPWWALVIGIAAFAAAGWLVVTGGPGSHGDAPATPSMLQVAPGGSVTLASLPAEQQVVYQAAAGDPDAFTHVRCYCGCEAFLDHRHLLDCFVRPAGGWEAHASGCAVCLAEAEQVLELRADGVPIDDISRRIDARFGGITPPAGT